MSDPLARVLKGRLCTGCGGCTQISDAITMEETPPGWLRPNAARPLTPDEARAFAATCPGAGLDLDIGGRANHPAWGPYLGVHTGHATDPALRRNASSGGALSAALVHLLESGQVDAIIQTAAADSPAYANRPVISRSAADIFAAAGSRYAPSAPLDGLGDILAATEETFAFVGKPCDVAGLRALARLDPGINARIPVMLSFFCAGVPAHAGARAVVEALGVAEADLAAFRYRGDGWPGFATATRHDGSSERMSYNDSWGKILTRHVQFRCRLCPDGTGGFADLVCADAWETDENGYPLFEEADGTSLIIARTETGAALLADAQEAGRIEAQPFEVDKITPMQPGQHFRATYTISRLAGLALALKPYPRYHGLNLLKAARKGRLKTHLRNIAGTAWRALKG